MTHAVSGVETLGGWLLGWVGPMTAWTAGILAVALLLDRVLEKRVGAAWRILPFAALAVRLALPVHFALPLGLAPPAAASLFPPLAVSGAAAGAHLGAHAAAGFLYLLVAAALLVRWGAARFALARALRGARNARPEVASLASPGTRVLEHATLGPLVAGTLRARIVLPSALVDALAPAALGCVLRHELAHVARRDPLLATFVQLVSIAAWPVLPVWIAAWRVRGLVEMACDEAALADPSGPGRRSYGEVLLAAASWPRLAPAAPLSFGSLLGQRIAALRLVHRWSWGLQALLALASVIALVTCAGTSDDAERAAVVPTPAPSGHVAPAFSDPVPAAASTAGSLDKDIIRRIVRRHTQAVKACYDAGLARIPTLAGTVLVGFTIDPNGDVVASEIQNSTLADADVETCIKTAVRTWTFPKPVDGGVVVVAYPFVLTP